MNNEFMSPFAGRILAMLEFKEALGYSRSSYYKFLLNFDRYCRAHYPNESILTQEIVAGWSMARVSETAAGVSRRLIAIREFGKYLASTGDEAYIIPSGFIGGVKKFMPYIYTDAELTAFFKGADSLLPDKRSPLREFTASALFRLMYCCGLRPSEIRLIKRDEVDFKENLILISESKSYKDRVVAVDSDVMALCGKYDHIADCVFPDRTYFFQGPNNGPYAAIWIQHLFRKCWKSSGISFSRSQNPRVGDFRHNYATRTLMNWLDEGKALDAYLPYLSAYMGHSDFSQTAYYIHLIPDKLIKNNGIKWDSMNAIIPEVDD